MQFDSTLRDEYSALFQTCSVRAGAQPWAPQTPWKEAVEHSITTVLRGGKRYDSVGSKLGIPFWFVGILHVMECSANFNLHIHNGDPLCSRTVNVPSGRPPAPWPIPGMSADELWIASTTDAMKFHGFDVWNNWTAEGALFCFEKWNGWGYRSKGIHSPYLWSGSSAYESGKYVADHVWSATAVSKQIGAGVILRRMVDQSLIELPTTPNTSTDVDDIPFAVA